MFAFGFWQEGWPGQHLWRTKHFIPKSVTEMDIGQESIIHKQSAKYKKYQGF
ncbi:hypothetical protein Bateq7PJ16_0613 [Bacillus subtilis]|nr:hypothetical protein Bateq7PJ16_0613 [Bacillus subtilis]GAK78469.1 hypothetical protein BSMD_003660 [Bacillus subtilis Miyagi-4]